MIRLIKEEEQTKKRVILRSSKAKDEIVVSLTRAKTFGFCLSDFSSAITVWDVCF